MVIGCEKIELSPAIQYINFRQLGRGRGWGWGGNGAYTRFALSTVFYFIVFKKRELETYQHCAMPAANYDYAK